MKTLSKATPHDGGQIMVMVGILAVVMIAFVGLAIDVGKLYATKAELARAVDAAALSGILEFDGTTDGLDAGEDAAEAYFDQNEPGPGVTRTATASGGNEMLVVATKEVNLVFLPLIGINKSTVSARARAGFGTQALDAAIVLDSTNSMTGTPITEAKNAAIDFTNILLGIGTNDNVSVGVTAFRGCYRASPTKDTAPMPTSKTNCVLEGGANSQVAYLTNNADTLEDLIEPIDATGGSGTNVCNGLAKGWEILDGPNNHIDEENNQRYLILLSDGDNNYNGAYTYQASAASPHSYEGYSCRPPSSCSASGYNVASSGSGVCYNGVNSSSLSITEGWESNNLSGGTGWDNSWSTSGSSGDTPTIVTTTPVQAGSRHLRIRSQGRITREFDLSDVSSATLVYWYRSSSLESGDNLLVQISSNNSTYTTLQDHSTNVGTYTRVEVNISSYVGDSSVFLRLQGSMGDTSDNFFVDSISITGAGETPANGYLNGSDGSASCGDSVKRERQLDILTWEMAKAIEAQGVTIFVVAFGACSSNGTSYTQAQCDAQIGDTENDNKADQRLLKCIASSVVENDHYYYASSASELPSIFTAIANQIAHRLVE